MYIDLNALEARHAHDLLTSCVIPRPIAWVSTVSPDGKTNLAPFSFFTGISWAPPVLAISVVNRADGTEKDTVLNIRQTNEFVVNLVSQDLLGAMEDSARRIPYGDDLYCIKGIDLERSKTVRPYRISQAKVSFECTLEQIVTVGEGANAGNLILGRIQMMAAADELLRNGREVDWKSMNALGRLSGNRYCVIDSVIESQPN